mgnify:CR=1 FL=1
MILIINIIDVGLGNIRSIEHWLNRCNVFSRRVSIVSQFTDDAIIIPGVSSAGEFMRRLINTGLDQEIINRSISGQKIIGICLGFQILTNYSEEDYGVECLGLLNGQSIYLDNNETHNGWEKLSIDLRKVGDIANIKKRRKKIIDGRVYYNHELKVELDDKCFSNQLESGITAFAFKNNIFGFQFHPEKSQETGRALIKAVL